MMSIECGNVQAFGIRFDDSNMQITISQEQSRIAEKLAKMQEELSRKIVARNEYDTTI